MNKDGNRLARVIGVVSLMAAGALFLFAEKLAVMFGSVEATIAVFLYCLILGFHFMALAGACFYFVRNRRILFAHIESTFERLKENEAPVRQGSLFGSVVHYLLILIIIAGVCLAVFHATLELNFVQHMVSISTAALIVMIVSLLETADPVQNTWRNAVTRTVICIVFSLGLLWAMHVSGAPQHFWLGEVIAWLLAVMVVWAWVENLLKRHFTGTGANTEARPFHAIIVIWKTSSLVELGTRGKANDSKSLAILVVLLIFVLPREIYALVPPTAASMFTDVWTYLGPLPFGEQHIPYIALFFFLALSSGDFGSALPATLSEKIVVAGPLMNSFFQAIYSVSLFITVLPLFAAIVAIGIAILGEQLVIVVGFFTFPSWAARTYALLTAVCILGLGLADNSGNFPDDTDRMAS